MNRKDYEFKTTYKTVDKIVKSMSESTDVTIISGGLLDNYFIDDFNAPLIVGGHRIAPRKHFIAYEKFLNSQSSEQIVILTDNDEKYYKMKKAYLCDILAEDKEEQILESDEREDFEIILDECQKMLEKM
jgi:hypothetical protein